MSFQKMTTIKFVNLDAYDKDDSIITFHCGYCRKKFKAVSWERTISHLSGHKDLWMMVNIAGVFYFQWQDKIYKNTLDNGIWTFNSIDIGDDWDFDPALVKS